MRKWMDKRGAKMERGYPGPTWGNSTMKRPWCFISICKIILEKLIKQSVRSNIQRTKSSEAVVERDDHNILKCQHMARLYLWSPWWKVAGMNVNNDRINCCIFFQVWLGSLHNHSHTVSGADSPPVTRTGVHVPRLTGANFLKVQWLQYITTHKTYDPQHRNDIVLIYNCSKDNLSSLVV